MGVTLNDALTPFLGNGATTTYTYDFPCEDEDELLVYVDGEIIDSGLYSVNLTTKVVTFTTAPASGALGAIIRKTEVEQLVTYSRQNGSLNLEGLASQLDAIVMKLQEVSRDVDKAVKTDYYTDPPRWVGTHAEGTVPIINANGNQVQGPTGTQIGNAQSYAAAALASQNAAEEWAENPEDDPVSVPAGGDDSTTFSALHWAAKADGHADRAEAAAVEAANIAQTVYPSKAWVQTNHHPATAPDYIGVAGYSTAGDTPPYFYKQWTARDYETDPEIHEDALNRAILIYPRHKSELQASSVEFQWQAGSGALKYQLEVGTVVGGNSIYDSGDIAAGTTTATATGIPTDGSIVYVRLWTQGADSTWRYFDYAYCTLYTAGLLTLTLADSSTVLYEPYGLDRTFEMYGAVGDDDGLGGGTDDTKAVRAALQSGGRVVGKRGAQYRCESMVPMAPHTKLDLNGSKLHFYEEDATHMEWCLMPGDGCEVTDGAVHAHGLTANLGDKQVPITIGSINPTTSVHDVTIRNVEVLAAWQNHLMISGRSSNITIDNLSKPAGSGRGSILAHFSGGPPLYYSENTFHPNNITIRNIGFGDNGLDEVPSISLYFSAAYNVTVENVNIADVLAPFSVVTGDFGSNYAPADLVPKLNKGIIFRNSNCSGCTTGMSISSQPFIDGGHVEVGVVVDNVHFIGLDATNTASRGIQLESTWGLEVKNSSFDGFYEGIMGITSNQIKNVTIRRCTFKNIRRRAAYIHQATVGVQNFIFEDNTILTCNTGGGTDADANSAIVIGLAEFVHIRRNYINSPSSAFGIRIGSSATNPVVERNHIEDAFTGAISMVATRCRGGGNTVGSGLPPLSPTNAAITNDRFGTKTFSIASIASGAWHTETVTVSGALVNDPVTAIAVDGDTFGWHITGQVTAAGTVTLTFTNTQSVSAGMASRTYTVFVGQRY